jgi:hypothetical protein
MDPKVNDRFLEWLNRKYDTYGAVKATPEHIHNYLEMTFDFSQEGKGKMINNSLMELGPKDINSTPAQDNLFTTNVNLDTLELKHAELFHTIVAKGLFLCNRARPNIHLTVSYISAPGFGFPTETIEICWCA